MDYNKPVVSIVMATYNRAHFILETIVSIQNQTFLNWQCIIVDDGGTDNTKEVIQHVLDSDKRFTYLKRPDEHQKGLPGCRNYGISLSKGNYIIFFDDDDIVHPQNIEICQNELNNSEYYFCRYLRTTFVDNFDYKFDLDKKYTSFTIDTSNTIDLITNKLPFNSCAVMWRKSCFEKNRFVEHLMYAEEWELYSRILSSDIQGISINKILFFGRKHPNSNTGEFSRKDHIRMESKKNAIVLITENLQSKNMLSKEILRYFIASSLKYKNFNLFSEIKKKAKLNLFQKMYWNLFYYILPFRLLILKSFKK